MNKEQHTVPPPGTKEDLAKESLVILITILTDHMLKTAPRTWRSYKSRTGATVISVQKQEAPSQD